MDGRERLMEFKLCELHHCINAQYSFKDQGPKDGNHHAALVTTKVFVAKFSGDSGKQNRNFTFSKCFSSVKKQIP